MMTRWAFSVGGVELSKLGSSMMMDCSGGGGGRSAECSSGGHDYLMSKGIAGDTDQCA